VGFSAALHQPLMVISGAAQLLLDNSRLLPNDRRQFLELILERVGELRRMQANWSAHAAADPEGD
jgi:hypothetical protein